MPAGAGTGPEFARRDGVQFDGAQFNGAQFDGEQFTDTIAVSLGTVHRAAWGLWDGGAPIVSEPAESRRTADPSHEDLNAWQSPKQDRNC